MTSIQGSVRAFIAIELPSEVRAELEKTQHNLSALLGSKADALKWARPEGLHLTIQFLGDVSLRLIGPVKLAMDKACQGIAPFTLRTSIPGVFPVGHRPRVVWVGVEGDLEPLNRLANAVHKELQALGYTPDKSFNPHLTLARVKEHTSEEVRREIAHAIIQLRESKKESVSFPATSISLMQSDLRPGGAVYTRLRSADLEAKAE